MLIFSYRECFEARVYVHEKSAKSICCKHVFQGKKALDNLRNNIAIYSKSLLKKVAQGSFLHAQMNFSSQDLNTLHPALGFKV